MAADELVTSAFDALADRYDLLVDWPKRLANEAPFFRGLFELHGVKRVADVACGTGHHAAMFHSWGLFVEGSDISSAMIDRCRQLHGEADALRWTQRSFIDPPPAAEPFDAVVCLGNSLALAGEVEAAARAIVGMVRHVRCGGVGVVHVLNLYSLDTAGTVWQKVRRVHHRGRSIVLLKSIRREGSYGHVEILEVDLSDEPPRLQVERNRFVGLTRGDIEQALRAAGAKVAEMYGSHTREAFDERRSGDLIVVWERGGTLTNRG
ncbi:MAG: class I SAM-dependent methyltransferase [Phycisphaerae bacterium]|nr:class I SAM-dependent methyltransferase [Phycisphaerae bacterium]